MENTHNRAGGVVVPQAEVLRICAVARELGLATFLDGARLWNASAASGVALHELAAPFELVAVAFSKGLGAPGGSLLAGSKALIAAVDRHRRRMGGAMRQNGIFSAAALHALDHHLHRLSHDHARAAPLGARHLRCPTRVLTSRRRPPRATDVTTQDFGGAHLRGASEWQCHIH